MKNDNAKVNEIKLLDAIKNVVKEDVTLKKNISLSEWLELKKALSPINNYITKELTNRFIEVLPKLFKNTSNIFENIDIKKLKDNNSIVNVNANGYDFVYSSVTAEVKANIPYEKKKYGGSQKTGLKKDINGLLSPIKKTKDKHDPTQDYKFLIVLDYKHSDYDTSKAVDDLIKNEERVKKIEDLNNPPNLSTNKVYIIMLEVQESLSKDIE